MANPQLENGYTRIANELYEAIIRAKLPVYESTCLHFVVRMTYGFQKKADKISFTQFERGTNIDRRAIARALKNLQRRKILIVTVAGQYRIYGIQKNYDLWQPLTLRSTVHTCPDNKLLTLQSTVSVPKPLTLASPNVDPTINGTVDSTINHQRKERNISKERATEERNNGNGVTSYNPLHGYRTYRKEEPYAKRQSDND